MNELKDICERLESSYKNDIKWILNKAEKVGPGEWVIEIKKEVPEGTPDQEEAHADNN